MDPFATEDKEFDPEIVKVNSDALTSANRQETADGAVRILLALQGLKKASQIMAIAAAFYILIRSTNLRPLDVLGYVNRMAYDKRHSTRMEARFAALRWHMKDFLMGKGDG